ncbi:hypothetical protein [Pseudoxanthomonas winnipegensis]|uniref:hypothetical protein n=1 Tax=Pseudoxanthomonas winnipegensis TaxID=2480810 RepID=UPI001D17D8E1|nr:hypothetical protein [Pseudoxanthomonas winnipegensis]
MKLLAHLVLFVALMAICATGRATSSLSFEGRGYWLDLEIGHADQPVVASITFHKPGDSKGVVLRDNFLVKIFDVRSKRLVLDYKGSDPRVGPFTLIVHGERATLETAGTHINSDFSWLM